MEDKKKNELGIQLDKRVQVACEALDLKSNFERTIAFGVALKDLREALDSSIMTRICKLQNTRLGFKTDKPDGYNQDVVKDCIIEACVHGLQIVGNMFNIIAGQMYVTREGVSYLLRKTPELTDLKIHHNLVEIRENSTSGTDRNGKLYTKIEREAEVKSDLEYTFCGKLEKDEITHVIRVNSGMSHDAIIGKADRKVRMWLYNRIHDISLDSEDAAPAPEEMRNVTPRTASADELFPGDGLPGVDVKI